MNNRKVEEIEAKSIGQVNINYVTLSRNGSKGVDVLYNGNQFVIQTPYMYCIDKLKQSIVPKLYELHTLVTGDLEYKVNRWVNFVNDLENVVMDKISNGFIDYFDNTCEIISISLFRRTCINDVDHLYIKWPILENVPFVDESYKEIPSTMITKNMRVKLIIELNRIWIKDNHFGLNPVVKKIMVSYPKIEHVHTYSFMDSEEKSSDTEDNFAAISILATENMGKKNIISMVESENIITPSTSTKSTKSNPSEKIIKKETVNKSVGKSIKKPPVAKPKQSVNKQNTKTTSVKGRNITNNKNLIESDFSEDSDEIDIDIDIDF